MLQRMKETHARNGEFGRVAENLFRYSSSGVYYARFQANGKDICRSLHTTDRALAKRRLTDEIEKASKIDPKVGKMPLSELLRLYDEHLAQYAPKTVATRHSIAKCFKETWPHGLALGVQEINAGQLEIWLAGKKRKVKNATFNEYARFLRQLFNLALKLRAIAVSPAADLHGIRVESPIRATPTWEQFHQIVEDIRNLKLNRDAEDTADLVEFMGLAGVGTAECANLRGEHIDLAKKRINLYREKTDTGYSIPIFPQLLPFLQKLEANGRIHLGQPVFAVKDPKKSLAAACKRLNMPHFSPRSLRRCFITRAIEMGIDFKTIAAWQGHRDGGVLIAKTYGHLRSEHSEAMAQRLVAQ
jgi:integrase